MRPCVSTPEAVVANGLGCRLDSGNEPTYIAYADQINAPLCYHSGQMGGWAIVG
jgi:hypothetical protein